MTTSGGIGPSTIVGIFPAVFWPTHALIAPGAAGEAKSTACAVPPKCSRTAAVKAGSTGKPVRDHTEFAIRSSVPGSRPRSSAISVR